MEDSQIDQMKSLSTHINKVGDLVESQEALLIHARKKIGEFKRIIEQDSSAADSDYVTESPRSQSSSVALAALQKRGFNVEMVPVRNTVIKDERSRPTDLTFIKGPSGIYMGPPGHTPAPRPVSRSLPANLPLENLGARRKERTVEKTDPEAAKTTTRAGRFETQL